MDYEFVKNIKRLIFENLPFHLLPDDPNAEIYSVIDILFDDVMLTEEDHAFIKKLAAKLVAENNSPKD